MGLIKSYNLIQIDHPKLTHTCKAAMADRTSANCTNPWNSEFLLKVTILATGPKREKI